MPGSEKNKGKDEVGRYQKLDQVMQVSQMFTKKEKTTQKNECKFIMVHYIVRLIFECHLVTKTKIYLQIFVV